MPSDEFSDADMFGCESHQHPTKLSSFSFSVLIFDKLCIFVQTADDEVRQNQNEFGEPNNKSIQSYYKKL